MNPAASAARVRGMGKCHGAVTAEFAVAMPAVLLLLAMLLAGAAAGLTQLRFEEAARAGARALARGEDSGTVNGIVRHLAGVSASAALTSDGEWLGVTVSGRVAGPVGSLIPWTLTAKAVTRGEVTRGELSESAGSRYAATGDNVAAEATAGVVAEAAAGVIGEAAEDAVAEVAT